MDINHFLKSHNSHPDQINAESCIEALMNAMKLGLDGKGNIPMIPSYLSTGITPPVNQNCCVLDAGGTNLRCATALFDDAGNCTLSNIHVQPMPGTLAPLSSDELYESLANEVERQKHDNRIGFCFSYNVSLDRTLDGPLDAWCKEVQCPDAVGKPVGRSLKAAMGNEPCIVHVLNDSVAAMLGASANARPVHIGLILGTRINVCYEEQCTRIGKIKEPLNSDAMIISTEIGEFAGIPKSTFDSVVISESSDPELAQAEKQCAGGYLGQQICIAWARAHREALLPDAFKSPDHSLGDISSYLTGSDSCTIPDHPVAKTIAAKLIERAAKIAAILCAGSVILSAKQESNIRIAIEGSQFWKLTGFRPVFLQELAAMVSPYNIDFEITRTENSCLLGAALAAFTEPM